MSVNKYPLKATSNILNLLGDELIGSDSLAIFELVKNSYDADAERVDISFVDLNTPNQQIIIEDDGCGMSLDIIHKVWLTIGTNFKKKEAKISKKFHRFSLGNKGVGRLAVHRLAESIRVETKMEDEIFGSSFNINWKQLVSSGDYIENLFVEVQDEISSPFVKGHGTRIILTGLKTKQWTKKQFRELVGKIDSFKNPLQSISDFEVVINCDEDKRNWIEDIKSGNEILQDCLYSFKFSLTPSSNDSNDFVKFDWEYSFKPHEFERLAETHKTSQNEDKLPISDRDFIEIDETIKDQHYLRNCNLTGIGIISGHFYAFNQHGPLMDVIYGAGRRDAIKNYIKDNCGIKVFRDNIRVYNYGEPYDDWLGLELKKIQRTGDHFSKKVTIGAVSLNLEQSESCLLEKTNREGFSENQTFWLFREIIRSVFSQFERIADEDRQLLEAKIEGTMVNKRVGLSDTIRELEKQLERKNLIIELRPVIKKIERDYNTMRDVMLSSGMTGLNLALVFHEIEREMRYICSDLNDTDYDINNLRSRIKNLNLLLENFSPILKQNSKIKLKASTLVDRVFQINKSRFRYHNIEFVSPLLFNRSQDFTIIGPGNLLVSSLSNIIDNAIYWVSDKHELFGDTHKSAIYVGTDVSSFDGSAIIITDTGAGFQLEPDIMVQPFKTNKAGGMGLGLYFVNLVMESIGGKLLFPDSKDLDVPDEYDGACVVLLFPKQK